MKKTFFLIVLGLLPVLQSAKAAGAKDKKSKEKPEAKEENATDKGEDREPEDPVVKAKRTALEKINLDNALREAKLKKALAAEQEAMAKLEREKKKLALAWELEAEKQRIAFEKEVAALKQEMSRAKLEVDRSKVEIDKSKVEIDRSKVEIDKAKVETDILRGKLDRQKQQFELNQLRLQEAIKRTKAQAEKVQAEITQLTALQKRDKYTGNKPTYPKEPLVNGVLTISDRCVKLDGVITILKANYVVDQLQFFNNKNATAPIFLLMTECWGGSCQAGYRIMKAMSSSKAPVYVVVKGFTASMGAVITSLASRSFALRGATILHHEAQTWMWGNKRNLEDEIRLMKKWEQLLHVPLAKKMGISLNKLNEKFVKSPRDNCWLEFADEAKKLRWVDHVIEGIHFTGVQEQPKQADYTWKKLFDDFFGPWKAGDKGDKGGKRVVYLPHLAPGDYYRVYNPDGRFQVAP